MFNSSLLLFCIFGCNIFKSYMYCIIYKISEHVAIWPWCVWSVPINTNIVYRESKQVQPLLHICYQMRTNFVAQVMEKTICLTTIIRYIWSAISFNCRDVSVLSSVIPFIIKLQEKQIQLSTIYTRASMFQCNTFIQVILLYYNS